MKTEHANHRYCDILHILVNWKRCTQKWQTNFMHIMMMCACGLFYSMQFMVLPLCCYNCCCWCCAYAMQGYKRNREREKRALLLKHLSWFIGWMNITEAAQPISSTNLNWSQASVGQKCINFPFYAEHFIFASHIFARGVCESYRSPTERHAYTIAQRSEWVMWAKTEWKKNCEFLGWIVEYFDMAKAPYKYRLAWYFIIYLHFEEYSYSRLSLHQTHKFIRT